MTTQTALLRIVLTLLACAAALLVWFTIADLPMLFRLFLAMVVGSVAVLGSFVWSARRRGAKVEWLRVAIGLALATLASVVGILINVTAWPDGPTWIKFPVGLAMPGSLITANVFARKPLDSIPFYGGFALTIVIWTSLAYFVVGWWNRARS